MHVLHDTFTWQMNPMADTGGLKELLSAGLSTKLLYAVQKQLDSPTDSAWTPCVFMPQVTMWYYVC